MICKPPSSSTSSLVSLVVDGLPCVNTCSSVCEAMEPAGIGCDFELERIVSVRVKIRGRVWEPHCQTTTQGSFVVMSKWDPGLHKAITGEVRKSKKPYTSVTMKFIASSLWKELAAEREKAAKHALEEAQHVDDDSDEGNKENKGNGNARRRNSKRKRGKQVKTSDSIIAGPTVTFSMPAFSFEDKDFPSTSITSMFQVDSYKFFIKADPDALEYVLTRLIHDCV